MQLSQICIIRRYTVIKRPKIVLILLKKVERRGGMITNFNALFCQISQLLRNFAPSLQEITIEIITEIFIEITKYKIRLCYSEITYSD